MRFRIAGDPESVATITGWLARDGVLITDKRPDYTVYLERGDSGMVVLDSIDCPLEAAIFRELRELAGAIIMQTAGGIQSDREARIWYTGSEAEAVERAVFRALWRFANPQNKGDQRSWFARLFSRSESRPPPSTPR